MYATSIGQVPKIIEALRSKGFTMSTAAECVGDEEPHTSPEKSEDDDDNDDDDDDDYSEDAKKLIKEDAFAASGSQSEKEQQEQNSAQLQEATSAANTMTFSAAIGFTLAACGILINYLI